MVALDIKRNLEEIRARYELEPSLKDVYVEGPNDRTILEWFLEKKGKIDVYVYQIDTVEVPDHVLRELNLNKRSDKDKVIALAEELSRTSCGGQIKARCIADADYDRYLGTCRTSRILEYTDYTSMEMYFFNEAFVKKFVNLVLRGFPVSPSRLIEDMGKVLQRIFLIRLANERLNWNMSWVKIRRYISWNGERIEFDEDHFLRSYLMENGQIRNLDVFKSVMHDFETKLQSDPRHNIRGHDFTCLFFLTAKKYRGRGAGFKDLGTFEGALCGCLELAFVEDERLFVKLGAL